MALLALSVRQSRRRGIGLQRERRKGECFRKTERKRRDLRQLVQVDDNSGGRWQGVNRLAYDQLLGAGEG